MIGRSQGRASGRRPVLRWAWRLFRREWRQQLLVLVLLTVSVAAAVTGAAVVVNSASTGNGEFGDASALIRLDGHDPAAVATNLATARSQFGTVDVITHSSVAVPGDARPLDLRAQDPAGPYGRPMLALRSGRYPTAAGEVALTSDVAALLSAHEGDTVSLGGVDRTVVGTVENPSQLDDRFALVAPSPTARADSFVVLVDMAQRTDTERAPAGPGGGPEGPGFSFEGKPTNGTAVQAVVLVAVTLGMSLVGLVAAAGFVVVAQRRQRQLGMLAAIGATGNHLRLVMVASGAIVGLVAAAGGAALGIGGWLAAAPAVETAANHRIAAFDLPWGLIAEILTLAVVVATAAAWWPARNVSRLSVMAALSGRPSPPRSVHWSLALAAVLLTAGVLAVSASHPTTEHVRPLVLIGGLLAIVVGVVVLSPAAIRSLGAPARRLPFAPRLALRDLTRYQSRSSAALAAITLSVGVSVAVIALAAAGQTAAGTGNLSTRQLLVRVGDPRTGLDPDLTAAQRGQLDDRAAAVTAAAGTGVTSVALDVAVPPANQAKAREPIGLGVQADPNSLEIVGHPYIATPAVLAHFGIDPDSVPDSTAILTSSDQPLTLVDFTRRPDLAAPLPETRRVALPAYSSAPNSLITPAEVQRQGWQAARAGWLIESPRAFTAKQIAAARQAAAAVGFTIEVRDQQDGLAALRTGATAAGGLLALAIIAMAIGLLRTESARDLRTLTATGANRRTRRALTASAAAALAVLGVVLGTAGAYLALVAGYHSDLARLTPVPDGNLLALTVGVPLAAVVIGWLLAGREPRSFARQALD